MSEWAIGRTFGVLSELLPWVKRNAGVDYARLVSILEEQELMDYDLGFEPERIVRRDYALVDRVCGI